MKSRTDASLRALCRSAGTRPWTWIVGALVVTLPALVSVREVGLDTDLIRLLPGHTRAAVETRALEGVVSGSSYFALILESDDPERLRNATEAAALQLEGLDGVASVEYRNPLEFIERFRYLLIPPRYLEIIEGEVLDWEAQANPMFDDLGASDGGDEETYGEREDRKEIEDRLQTYGDLPELYSSRDGTLTGIFIHPRAGATSLGATRRLFHELQLAATTIAAEHGVWAGVSGSMRNKIDEYDVIVGDLGRSGLVAGSLILLTLLVAFRTVPMALLPLLPLGIGLLWGFALVPWTVGDLNTITAFLLLIVFGMGIDYSVHLLQRFRLELASPEPDHGPDAALLATYTSTGRAVAASGVSTALALGVLAVSDFRGFSEFGIVGGISICTVLLAMFVVFPATLVLGARHGLIHASAPASGRRRAPGRGLAVALLVAVVIAGVAAVRELRFDYDFSNLRANNTVAESRVAKDKQRQVFTTTRSPAAIYVTPGLEALDEALRVVRRAQSGEGSTIGRIASVRDFVPDAADEDRRRELIAAIQEDVAGSWTRRIEDPAHRRWVDDLRAWQAPSGGPTIAEVPETLAAGLFAGDDSGRPLLAIYPSVERSLGHNAMAFTDELYGLALPEGVRGPVGETPVFAEILWLVLGEGPWLVLATLGGVVLIVLAWQRSVSQAAWILVPLVTGMILTLGVMALLGIRLNFFNVVVLPALLGLGVDDGVHYYRRWRELGGDVAATQDEMLGPLTVTSLTTIMGYSGMLFANHQGLYSIGLTACLGLALIWFTSLFLLPPLLGWLHPPIRPPGAALVPPAAQ